MTKPRSVDEYLARVPPPQRAALEKLRTQILESAPGVVERIAWGVPMFQVDGRYVAGFAAYKEHLSFAPWGGWGRVVTEKELKGVGHTAGAIRFTPEKMMPARLVRRLVRATIKANEARATARRNKPPSRFQVGRPKARS
jgi:uncharacterized protein YdhG (YjbR/CyaY superfamily)